LCGGKHDGPVTSPLPRVIGQQSFLVARNENFGDIFRSIPANRKLWSGGPARCNCRANSRALLLRRVRCETRRFGRYRLPRWAYRRRRARIGWFRRKPVQLMCDHHAAGKRDGTIQRGRGAGSCRRTRTEGINEGGTGALATRRSPASIPAKRFSSAARAARHSAQTIRCERSALVAGAPAAAEFSASL